MVRGKEIDLARTSHPRHSTYNSTSRTRYYGITYLRNTAFQMEINRQQHKRRTGYSTTTLRYSLARAA
jgi:hypothetical protein